VASVFDIARWKIEWTMSKLLTKRGGDNVGERRASLQETELGRGEKKANTQKKNPKKPTQTPKRLGRDEDGGRNVSRGNRLMRELKRG